MPRNPRHSPEVVDLFAEPVDSVLLDAVAVDDPDIDEAEPVEADEPILAAEPAVVPVEPVPVPASRPAPESTLTPEQRRIRDLENQLAVERGRKDIEPELEAPKPAAVGGQGNILIHFLGDGFTALSKVWYRGQELEITPGSAAYRDTCDRNGRSWLELRDDDFAQIQRWGEVMFRSGPWPGKTYDDAAKVPFERLKPLRDGASLVPSAEQLEAASAAERSRARAAPRLRV